jgi:hypothetical protein
MMTDVTLASASVDHRAQRRHRAADYPQHRGTLRLASGPTARRLGTFLMSGLYQGSAVACAMFLTGQASNDWPSALPPSMPR